MCCFFDFFLSKKWDLYVKARHLCLFFCIIPYRYGTLMRFITVFRIGIRMFFVFWIRSGSALNYLFLDQADKNKEIPVPYFKIYLKVTGTLIFAWSRSKYWIRIWTQAEKNADPYSVRPVMSTLTFGRALLGQAGLRLLAAVYFFSCNQWEMRDWSPSEF